MAGGAWIQFVEPPMATGRRLLCMAVGHKADLVPSVHPECYFPLEQRGRWLMFESERHEQVVVDPGHVTFSRLGSFICKSKHWRKDQYKTLSVYANGWSVFAAQYFE